MRVEVLVRPGAVRPGVGGSRGGVLVVRVAEPPSDGRATRAALGALADALGVRPRQVTLVRGATSRRKLFEVATTPEQPEQEELLRRQLSLLLRAGDQAEG